MALNMVTLTFALEDAGQDAGSGPVTITPTSVVTAAGQTVVSQQPVVRQVSGGAASVSLVACDNSGTVPASGFWAYEIALPGAAPQPYLVNFAAGATQRFDSLTPAIASTTYGPAASASAGVTSFNSRTGAVVPASGDYTYSQVGADASGAATTALASAEAYAVAKAGDTMTGKLAPKAVTLTDGSSVPINAGAGNVFDWPLGGASHTLAAPANPADGQVITVRIKYGGSFTPLFNAVFDFASSAPAWTATSGKSDHAAFAYDAAANSNAGAWRCLNSGGLGYTS